MQPRRALTRDEWTRMAGEPSPPLLALWADTREVYALLRDGAAPLLVSTEVEDGGYPALSPARPAAVWFERMVRDLWGHTAIGGTDQRPWLDHGHWPISAPLALHPGPPGRSEAPEFLFPAELDQFPLGPVRGGIEPAAHLRLGIRGETIVRLEARLGYTHKGTLTLMRGKSPRAAARFAARLAGEATVAHSIAFARATEAALGCEVPARALAWRDVMAEVERIAGHLDALAAMAEAAGTEVLATRSAWHGEAIRRAADLAFGHRLMMDCVVPGGVAADIAPGGSEAIGRALSGRRVGAAGAATACQPSVGRGRRDRRSCGAVRCQGRRCRDACAGPPGRNRGRHPAGARSARRRARGRRLGAVAGGERRGDRFRRRARRRDLALAEAGLRTDRQRVPVRSGLDPGRSWRR